MLTKLYYILTVFLLWILVYRDIFYWIPKSIKILDIKIKASVMLWSYLSLSIGLRLWKILSPDYACTIFFKVPGLRTVKSHGRVTLHIFVKEREGSSEKISKYVNCTYGRIFVPSQKQNFMIYACTIAGRIKTIERERYISVRIIL